MITVSSKGIYGLIALTEFAENYDKKTLQIKEIAKKKNIPRHYLEQILLVLKRCGIVKSYRGIKGGYSLSRPPEKITLAEILDSLETELKLNRVDIDSKFFNNFWNEQTIKLKENFNITLKEILEQKNEFSKNYIYNI
jgi:Rrf2 family transcriptional regulator, cysteine metabolism repressor